MLTQAMDVNAVIVARDAEEIAFSNGPCKWDNVATDQEILAR